ncbi:MAG: uracil-DNA glycosylase [Thaumarchaeota archaeon]|jgi:uracil-DNA glycosylase family 4|nr:uracil-DNA glycosylase [Nitrososphaerota archaeon]
MQKSQSLISHNKKIIKCKKCRRLSSYIKQVSKKKPKRYKNQKYWAKPLPGFGDVNAKVLIVGLAPAAHGGNRTGRMFTGDSSGDWVAKVLHQNGFSNKPTSTHSDDGFTLIDAYITAVLRCAPPQNKPLPSELENCSDYLRNELALLVNIKVIVCLGRIAFFRICKILDIKGEKFSHGHSFQCNEKTIICSYHPSRQNTQTGRLSWKQWNLIFKKTRELI